jgi:hypothetical protein
MTTNRFPGIGYNYKGRDFNFFEKLDVVATTFGGESVDGYQPDMIIPFSTQSVMMINDGYGVLEYSFNGHTIHGELDSAKASAALSFDNRVIFAIWFRIKAGSSGPITASVHAWGIR